MTDRCAGILIPLFSVRSTDDWGRGEFGALVPLGAMALSMGHRLIQLLPIDEVAPTETSPYSALSVFALDPIYVSVGLVSGAPRAQCQAARAELRREDRASDQRLLRIRKDHLLAQAFRQFKSAASQNERDGFRRFVECNRSWLDDYAAFRALKDNFGGTEWENWPPRFRRHEPDALLEANRDLAEQIALFKYVQYVARRQWSEVRTHLARMGVMLGGDLAFSPCRESVEVWAHQELFDLSRSVGAPPDAFSDAGQRWGLPMPDWERMRSGNFEFLRMRVRHARELYDLLRIDHVVGLYRTYGYPLGDELGGEFDPATEAAQRAQGCEIMQIVLEEAGPMQIVAEDLGLIPKFVRDTLAALAVPGYKVLRWEKDRPGFRSDSETSGAISHSAPYLDPAKYPLVSLATTGTHDTETLVEWWATINADERRRFLASLRIAAADCERAALDETTLDAILESAYASPSQLVVTPMQDLFGWDARINFPGTISEANWSWRLPFDVDQVQDNRRSCERIARLRMICERTGRFRG